MSTTAHFSLAHYEHMVEVGAFSGPASPRLELIRGKLIEKGRSAPAKFTLVEYENMIRAAPLTRHLIFRLN